MDIVLEEGAKVPERATKGSVGYDLCAYESSTIWPETAVKIRTGVRMEIPEGLVGIISHRSGMNSQKMIQAYGVVDPDYRGELIVTLYNNSPSQAVRVMSGDKIAQIVFTLISRVSMDIVEELDETERGDNGHGSTGE